MIGIDSYLGGVMIDSETPFGSALKMTNYYSTVISISGPVWFPGYWASILKILASSLNLKYPASTINMRI